MRGARVGLVKRDVRKVFSELDGDGRMSPGGWPGWMEQKEGRKSQDERKENTECVLGHRKLTSPVLSEGFYV